MKKAVSATGRFIRKHWILFLIITIILYLAIGALAPFAHYKDLSDDYMKSFNAQAMLEPEVSTDRAMIMETNLSAWEERIRMMDMAKERILISSFDIRDGESTKDLMAVLLHKADEGVKIQIVVDGINGALRMEGRDIFFAASSHPNIEIKFYNTLRPWLPWTTQGRMHDKYIIVDDLAYIIGGRNMFDYFIGDYESDGRSFDREMLIYNTAYEGGEASGSSLYELEAYFDTIWNLEVCKYFHENESLRNRKSVMEQLDFLDKRYETLKVDFPELFGDFDYTTITKATEGVHLLSGQTSIYAKEPQVFYQLIELMMLAKDRVIIHTPYAVCNDYMYDKLTQLKAAVPDTRMMINSVSNGDNVVASSDYLKNKQKLIDTGITIYEYDGGTSYHGKSMVIDHYATIVGSFNLDLRSTYMDTELMLLVKSEEITKELADFMDAMENDCRKVLDKDHYETPEHVIVADVPFIKKFLFKFLGFVLAPFRYVI